MDNSIKTRLQQHEFEALKGKHSVILKWATGCGKSKMVIDLINYALSSEVPLEQPKILFVVAEKAHKKNWALEQEKWGLSKQADIKHICYASLHKMAGEHFSILVLDEAHHLFTGKRMEALGSIAADYVFLLSATLPDNKIEIAGSIFRRKFITSTVTLKDATESGILPNPRLYVVELELDKNNASQEIKIGNSPNPPIVSWEERAKYIYRNKPCIIKCTEFQKYLYYTVSMEYWKQRYMLSKNAFHKNKWVNLGSQRKRFIGELKTAAARKLLSRVSDKRFVCFCASIAQADSLAAQNTISSKKTTKYNQALIDAFNSGDIDQLFAVNMITEGMNLNNIQVGIIVQLDGTERLFVQKFGRSLRAEDPLTFILYYRNTQDEEYLKTALSNIENKFVKYISINQLKTIKL